MSQRTKASERSVDGLVLIRTCYQFAQQGKGLLDVARHFGLKSNTILSRLHTLKFLYPQYRDFKFKVKEKVDYVPRQATKMTSGTVCRLAQLIKEQMGN